jgi:hypothetical protein
MKLGDLVLYIDKREPYYRLNNKIGIISYVYTITYYGKPIILYFVYINNENIALSKDYINTL